MSEEVLQGKGTSAGQKLWILVREECQGRNEHRQTKPFVFIINWYDKLPKIIIETMCWVIIAYGLSDVSDTVL